MSARGIRFGILLLVANAACGTDSAPTSEPPSFGVDPDETIASDSGQLTIAVRYAPDPPSVGTGAALLTFTDPRGGTLSGLALTVIPWMPAHGHGTSVNPTITETAPGQFL